MAASDLPDPGQPRSFVRRAGRVTQAQRRALDEHWPCYGLEPQGIFDRRDIFGREAPLWLEIGFGMGDTLAALAIAHPERDYIGVEVHQAGIGRLLHLAAQARLRNLKVVQADALAVLDRCIAPASLSGVLLYFPDPWPKKRHHKRRIVQPPFVRRVCEALVPGGRFLLATDWEDYAVQMLELLDAEPRLRNVAGPGCFARRPPDRPQTKFERRGLALGHRVRDLVYERRGQVPAGAEAR